MAHDPNDTWTLDALEKGDIVAIQKRAADDPAYLTSRDSLGDTPLQLAVDVNNFELVQFLLQLGANPNADAGDGYTCLLTVIESEEKGSLEMMNALIASGADIHKTGTSGWAPLHMAAARGQVEKAKLLLAAGAQVNQCTVDDETPLMEAASAGQSAIVQFLLDHGADPSMRDAIPNQTALEKARVAAAGPDPEIYNLLKQENPQNSFDMLEDLGIELDISPEQQEILKQSIENVDMAEHYQQSAKELVQRGDHAEVIQILSNHSESID